MIDNGYVARSGSSLLSVDDVDRVDVKVAVAEHSPADSYLSRNLKKAKIIRLQRGIDEARHALTFGSADVYADNVQFAYQIAAEIPGAKVLVGRFNSVTFTFVVPKKRCRCASNFEGFHRRRET